jgi:hypothetical protein
MQELFAEISKPMTNPLDYQHTQKGPWWLVLLIVAVVFFTVGWFNPHPLFQIMFLVLGVAIAVLAAGFVDLTIEDAGDHLLVRFGPLPLFRKRVRYDDIVSVERGRITMLDGWGIHWNPRSGWVWNIWGWDCLVLETCRGKLKLGTDDPEGLLALVRAKAPEAAAAEGAPGR